MSQFIFQQNTIKYDIYQGFQLNNMMQPSLNIGEYVNYRPCKNQWSVQFVNDQGLSILQIQKMFAFYGKVDSVVQLRSNPVAYVNYEKELDAEKCVLGLMNHSRIKLRRWNKTARPSTIPGNNGDSLSKNDVTEDQAMSNVNNESISSLEDSDIPEVSSNISPEPMDSAIISYTKGSFQSDEPEKMSFRMTMDSLMNKAQHIITAQEVIVGNIHEDYGVFYILHLLERYRPICISSMKKTEKNLRYCHIYFETPALAEAAEINYDNVELIGKRLIVMRTHALALQALQEEE